MPDPGPCLIIEDEPVHGLVLQEQLELMGYASRVAAGAVQGLAMLERERFAFALLDIRMPFMDGWQTARVIRSSLKPWHGLPIIAVTALAYQADIERTFAAGMNGYIAKPHEFQALERLIRAVLREYSDGRTPAWNGQAKLARIADLCFYLPRREPAIPSNA